MEISSMAKHVASGKENELFHEFNRHGDGVSSAGLFPTKAC